MTYPDNFENKIDFQGLINQLKQYCLGNTGKEKAENISFLNDYKEISRLINETEEFRQILLAGRQFPADHYHDLRETLKKTRVEGAYMEKNDLHILKKSLVTFKNIKNFFKADNPTDTIHLRQIANNLAIYPLVSEKLEKIITDEGEIKDKASPELYRIRQDITQKNKALNGKIQHVLHKAQEQGFVKADAQLSFRDGKAVIPVDANNKRKIHGYIHDESATGKTVYIEPAAVVEINNAIRELYYAERREIIRILVAFADFLRPYADDLLNNYKILGTIDLIRAKAKLALQLDAIKPVIENKPLLNWIEARHPLMYLTFKNEGKDLVTQNLRLNDENRIMLLSGPNAGGKSVCLKTVGIIQYMFQCGMLVPMEPDSTMGIFENIYIHIGDEQSIENDLSTYSAYLKNMQYFLSHIHTKSMILIDEFGSGTEPVMGGAIAEALLTRFIQSGTFGVITTHYTSLKQYASSTEGIINGALLFDTKKLNPLYILETGKPGNSFAFEIAKNAGLPNDILEDAEQKTGKGHIEFDRQLQELQQDKYVLEEKRKTIEKAEKETLEMLKNYKEALEDIKKLRKEIMQKAHNEAQELLNESNKKIENTIRTIKETEAEKQKTKNAREQLKAYREKTVKKNLADKHIEKLASMAEKDSRKIFKTNPEETKANPLPQKDSIIREGDNVKIKGSEVTGKVISIGNKKAKVRIGEMTSTQQINKLQKTNTPEAGHKTLTQKSNNKTLLGEKKTNFRPHADLRGYRADEALDVVKNLLDNAIVAGVNQVSILHGKGSGILRQMIRDYLKTEPAVVSFRDEHPDRGGSGITIAVLDI